MNSVVYGMKWEKCLLGDKKKCLLGEQNKCLLGEQNKCLLGEQNKCLLGEQNNVLLGEQQKINLQDYMSLSAPTWIVHSAHESRSYLITASLIQSLHVPSLWFKHILFM